MPLAFRLIYLYLPLYAISHITVAVSITLISSASISISYAPGALISHSVHSINLISFNGLPLRLQSVCLYRSYRQEARQAAAAACSSPAAFLKGIGLRIYGNAVSAQRISVNLGAAPCSQCSQGSAAR